MRKVIFNICLATIVNFLCFEMNQIVKSNKLEESCEESSSIEGVDCGCKKKNYINSRIPDFPINGLDISSTCYYVTATAIATALGT